MAKGKIIVKGAVKRKKGFMYFVDGDGNLRETARNTKGGKKGRTVCKSKKKAAPKKKRSVKRAPRKIKRNR